MLTLGLRRLFGNNFGNNSPVSAKKNNTSIFVRAACFSAARHLAAQAGLHLYPRVIHVRDASSSTTSSTDTTLPGSESSPVRDKSPPRPYILDTPRCLQRTELTRKLLAIPLGRVLSAGHRAVEALLITSLLRLLRG